MEQEVGMDLCLFFKPNYKVYHNLIITTKVLVIRSKE